MKVKRLAALSLVVVLIVGMLAACGESVPEVDKIISAAEGAMEGGIYSATVTTGIASAREDINGALAALDGNTVSIAVNGKNFKMDMELSTGNIAIVKSFTAYGGTLYGLTEVAVGSESVSDKKKAELGGEAVGELLSALGAGAEVSADDFISVVLSGEDGEYEIVCSQIKTDAKDILNNMMASGFEDSEIATTLQDVTYTIKISGGTYKSTTLEASYAITEPDDVYTVTVTTTTEYEYGTAPKIDAPQNAAEYEEVALDSIV